MAFAYYSPFTVQTGQVPALQTDFPMLLLPTDNRFRTIANGGHVQSASGYDLRPYSNSGLTSALTFELVPGTFNATTGFFEMWVKVPVQDGYVVYLGYDDATLVTDGSSTATWESSFTLVSHYPNGIVLSVADSTSNANNGTNHGATPVVTARGGGLNTNAVNQYVDYGLLSALDSVQHATLSMWTYRSVIGSVGQSFGQQGTVLGFYRFNCLWFSDDNVYVSADNAQNALSSYAFAAEAVTGFHQVSLVFDGTQGSDATRLKLYWDGVQQSLTFANGTPTSLPSSVNHTAVTTGVDLNTTRFWGQVADECRLATVSRDQNYITTEYNNQVPNSTFYVIGTEVAVPVSGTFPGNDISFRMIVGVTNLGNQGGTVGNGPGGGS